jgi:hypothetical protein
MNQTTSAHRTKSADDILVAIAETPDITLVELQKKLQARGVSAGIGRQRGAVEPGHPAARGEDSK